MTTTQSPQRKTLPAALRGLLSLLVPGLGQMLSGEVSRGLSIFISTAVLSALTVYTAAQRPRYPDYAFSFNIFLQFLLQTGGLFLALALVYRLIARLALKDEVSQSVGRILFVVVAVVALGIASGAMVGGTIPAERERDLWGLTALLGAASVTAIWLWGAYDAYKPIPTTATDAIGEKPRRGLTPLLLLLLAGIVVLGTQLIEIDLPKAIREYRDTERVLGQIFWPWRAAFDYKASALEATAKIEAPCIDENAAPPVNQPKEGEPWIVVTPTCGDLSVRDQKGNLTFGTLLTIKGGGFAPGLPVKLQWEDPIGNIFTPRGVGETTITISDEGTFETQLYVPSVVIPSVAQGVQIHTLHAVQEGAARFTGQLSREFKLALQHMLETIMLGLMATFAGIVFSVPFSFLAARNLMYPIRTTTQGFVGGVIGLALGGWAGKWLAGAFSALFGGLEQAPVLTALAHLVFILGLAVLFFRLLAGLLDWIAARVPAAVIRLINLAGFALIGGGLGYVLGVLFAKGVLSIAWTEELVRAATPRTGALGALLLAAAMVAWGFRMGEADKVPIGRMIYTVVRLVLNIVRSIEPLIWAVIGIIWVGPGPFAGTIALTLHTIAALGKLYSEAIESIDPGPIEALQATGANRLQTIMYAVVPQVLPSFTAFTLYRWDINVRMSTVIGLVGGGGIGFLLIQWIRQFQYTQAGLAVWLITLTVAALDFISGTIREKMV